MSIALEVNDRVGSILLDRPWMNVLDRAHQRELEEAAKEAAQRPEIRAVVICGAGLSFSAGADIREMAALTPAEMREHAPVLQRAFTAVARIPKPVCAAIEGYALGGGLELALAADFRICGENSVLGLPEIKLGVMPGAGGTQRLTRLVGPANAKRIMMTGAPVGTDDAILLGLVDAVVKPGTALAAARSLATELANGPAAALAAIKTAVEGSFEAGGFRLETELFARLFGTPDQVEGMAAFLEKRTVRFH